MSDFDTFDLYQVLGVDRDASEAEIRDAFNRAALTEHPDRSGHPDADQRIRRVYQARDTLLNARLRAAYDPDADQRARREAQERERRTPPQPTPRRPEPPEPPPPPRAPRSPKPQSPPEPEPPRERTDREEDRDPVRRQLRELGGSTILSQRRWFRSNSDRQHYYVAAYAEFLRQEQRYLNALRFVPGLLFGLLAIGSFSTGDVVGGIVSLIIATLAFFACRYLAEREWFIWPYLIVAVPSVELAKIVYAGLRFAFHFIRDRLRERWAARARRAGLDD